MCTQCAPLPAAGQEISNAAEAFAEKLLETVNHGMLSLMVSIGHRTNLFDAMQNQGWVTSDELAELAGLNERYVREWLGAMATGRIVEVYDEDGVDRFYLPDAHAEVLAQAGEGLGTIFQWIGILGEVESKVVDCFRQGGGVPYEAFSRFHEVMAEESNLTVVSGLHEHIVPLVDGLADDLERGIDLLDIGCGSGRAVCELARRYPRSRFVGYDLCAPAIERARQYAADLGLSNVTFEAVDITSLDIEDRFDVVTGFDVIHDQRDPAGALDAVRRVLKPGGTFLMQDIRAHSRVADNIGHPLCPLFYAISTMHCMTVSLAQGGAGLGTVWGEELAVQMLNDAGFEGVTVNTLPHDIQNNWYVMRKPNAVLEAAA